MPRMIRSSVTSSVVDVEGLDGLAVADDRDRVGDRRDLVELVRDDDAGDALRRAGRAAGRAGARSPRRSAPRSARPGSAASPPWTAPWRSPPAAACRRRCPSTGVTGFSRRPTRAQQLGGLGVGPVPVDQAAAGPLVAEEDVLGDRQVRAERQLLVDDDDAALLAVADAGELARLAVEDDLARRTCRAGRPRTAPSSGSTCPAPFSPQIAWTSPRRTVRLTSCRALTPGNVLVMPRIRRMCVGHVDPPLVGAAVRQPVGGSVRRRRTRHAAGAAT